jgi:2-hydroxychromene-2-carboxylate isomerase
MVMRGVPATRVKGTYIMTDCGREARASGVPFGPIYDPIGDPVRRCYAIYPWACEQGKGNALLSSFLRLAFAKGVNTNKLSGLQEVVEQAGLDWQVAKEQLADTRWEAMVEQNRLAMYEAGLWGVPSFRLLDKDGNQVLALWGQDRLWLFSREIQRLLKAG